SFATDHGVAGQTPDRRLYRLDGREAAPVAITPIGPPDTEWRYADGTIDRPRRRWIGVREQHTTAGDGGGAHAAGVDNTIVAVSLDAAGPDSGTVMAAGHDFFSSPRVSPPGPLPAGAAGGHPHKPPGGAPPPLPPPPPP